MLTRTMVAIALASTAFSSFAATSINLSDYRVTANYALDTLNDMGPEASAVTYARDRNSLFLSATKASVSWKFPSPGKRSVS